MKREDVSRHVVELPATPDRIARRIDDELEFHIEERTRELMASGASLDAARARAEAEFGAIEAARRDLQQIDSEADRQRQFGDAIHDLWFDIRRTTRALARRPGYVMTAALTLALGLGANATMFFLVDRLLLSPPPHIRDADDVVHIRYVEEQPQAGSITWIGAPYSFLKQLAEAPRNFDVATYLTLSVELQAGSTHRIASIQAVSPGYFDFLGTRPANGRLLGTSDMPDERNVVISHALWNREFGGEDVAGQQLTMAGQVYTITGVAPSGFTGPNITPVDAWITSGPSLPSLPVNWQERLNARNVYAVARPRNGATESTIASEATRLYRAWRANLAVPDSTATVITTSLIPGRQAAGSMTTDARVAVWLQGVSLLVLLIAIVNVANLMLLRGIERRRETAVALALGGTRWRLARATMLESFALGLVAALFATVVARWTGPLLWQFLLPAGTDMPFSWRNAAIISASAMGCAIILPIVPALFQLRTGVAGVLGDGARGASRRGSAVGDTLVVVQVACAVILLVGSGLFVRSMWNLEAIDQGIDVDGVLAVRIDHGRARDSIAAEQFLAEAERRVAALPGVQRVASSVSAPYRPSLAQPVYLPGYDQLPGVGQGQLGYPTYFAVSPTFFETMGLSIREGRSFTDADNRASSLVVIVDATMARTFWPDGDAVGRCFRMGADTMPCVTVVGVVQDSRRSPIEERHSLRYYIPLAQTRGRGTNHYLFVRAAVPVPALTSSVRSTILGLGGAPPLIDAQPLERFTDPYTRPWRLGRAAFLAFGALATVIATIGLYGMIAFSVIQRHRELGIRFALGASRGSVVRLVMQNAGARTLVGLVVGGVAAVVVGAGLRDVLFRTEPFDVPSLAVASAVLVAAAAVSCIVPTFRALRVDPSVTLRSE